MDSSDSTSNKKIPLEGLTKEELIKKCNNLLIIAKRAKQAKDESSEELKKYKENELKLSSDVIALKEVVESFNQKQNEFAEIQNKHKISEEKNLELQRDFQRLQEKYASKIAECCKFEEILKKLSDKISVLEICNSEYIEKLNSCKETYSKADIENKINLEKLKNCEKNETELKTKLHMAEEKYIKLEITLKEFQEKYMEECKQHEELHETLIKLHNKNSSGRCSSRSSDSLRPVYENQEYDEILEKYNELNEKNKQNTCEVEKLNKKLCESENLVKEWSAKYNDIYELYKAKMENWDDLVAENKKLSKDLNESEKIIKILKEKELQFEQLVIERNKNLLNQDQLIKEIQILKDKISIVELANKELKDKLKEKISEYDNLQRIFNDNQSCYNEVKLELKEERENNNKLAGELNQIRNLLKERTELLNKKTLENDTLMNNLTLLEQVSNELKVKLNQIMKRHNLVSQISENHNVLEIVTEMDRLYTAEIEKLSAVVNHREISQNLEKENLKQTILENEKLIAELKKNYDTMLIEKDKLMELCQGDKSTEEILKKNIFQLQQELESLREENNIADKKYKEMERKLNESKSVSEFLQKEIEGKCDEYDAFEKEVEFYKCKNDELNQEINDKKNECISYKVRCHELETRGEESDQIIENLKEELETTKNALKEIEEYHREVKKELLQDEKRSSKNENTMLFYFEDIHSKEKFNKDFSKYMKDKNVVDSVKLLEDLIKSPAHTSHHLDQCTCTDENYLNTENLNAARELETENENLKRELEIEKEKNEAKIEAFNQKQEKYIEKITLLYGTIGEMKSIKALINKELQDGFNILQMEKSKILKDIMKRLAEVIYNLQSGNSELLSEMNVMNQALKERGETISKLEKINESQHKELLEINSKVNYLELKLSEKQNKIKNLIDELEEFKLDIEDKEKAIKDMEEEIWKLKNCDSQAEALSSSTLSRVEEAARLMDVEESFEERYSKLKTIAIKLKKKINEQQKQLEEERNKSVAKSNEFQSKISNFQSQIKLLMNLQTDYDRLQDTYEKEKVENSSLKKSMEAANEKMELFKQEIEALKRENEKLSRDKNSLETVKKNLFSHIVVLKASIEEEKSNQEKLQKQIEKNNNDRIIKDKKLDEEKEKHKATLLLLEKQKMETKNLGVLKLEIAEYEKSVSDLEKKLAIKDQDIQELTCLLENQKSQCKLYIDEITLLKSQLTQENERATEANIQMKRFNEESNSREMEFQEKLTEISILKNAVEEKKREIEELSLKLALISNEKLKIEEKYKSVQEQYSREVHSLQDTLSNVQDCLSQKDLELSELKKEFEAYKIRAQSVLRQSQKEMNHSQQRNVIEELEQLRSTSESLKTRLEESGLKMQKLIEENELFQDEKNRLYTRIQELKNSLAEVRTENQELKQTKQKDAENHNEALRLQKLQSETLVHCFQKKMEELEVQHKLQLEELNKDHELLQKQFQKIITNVNENVNEKREYNEYRGNPTNFVPVKPDKEILDVMFLERDECEGSESVVSISPQTGNSTHLIPLDQLLSRTDNMEQYERKKSPFQDINHLNEKLEKHENRIKHLTILLSEAESDCARLQHLNDVLKEEIRRNQRNVEREQHAQNFEYMKNVVLKFISLHNVDERIRLVPVLNTILKLSPEEENILANAAKGILEHSNSNRGWGSYLNIWPNAS